MILKKIYITKLVCKIEILHKKLSSKNDILHKYQSNEPLIKETKNKIYTNNNKIAIKLHITSAENKINKTIKLEKETRA